MFFETISALMRFKHPKLTNFEYCFENLLAQQFRSADSANLLICATKLLKQSFTHLHINFVGKFDEDHLFEVKLLCFF